MVVAVALAIMFANYHQMVLTMVIPILQKLVPFLSIIRSRWNLKQKVSAVKGNVPFTKLCKK